MYFNSSDLVSLSVAFNYNQVSRLFAASASRLSSGLRIQHPSDGALDFIRGNSLLSNVRIYQDIKSNISDYQSMLAIAGDAGAEIRTKLELMLEKAVAASDASLTAGERSALFTEYDALRSGIEQIVDGTEYSDKNILASAGTYNQSIDISITPDNSVSMTIDLNSLDVSDAGPGGIIIESTAWVDETDAAASATEISTALDTVDTFLAQASGYTSALDSHARITDTIIENSQAASSSFLGVDTAQELVNFTALDVQKQAAAAVLSQTNISQRYILQLFKFD